MKANSSKKIKKQKIQETEEEEEEEKTNTDKEPLHSPATDRVLHRTCERQGVCGNEQNFYEEHEVQD